jgi:hypothetical protein
MRRKDIRNILSGVMRIDVQQKDVGVIEAVCVKTLEV